MKLKTYALLLSGMVAATALAQDSKDKDAANSLPEEKDKLGYALGLRTARYLGQMKSQGYIFDLKAAQRAVDDFFAGKPPLLSDQDAQNVMNEVSKRLRAEAEAKRKAQGEKNKVEGAKYLSENKAKPGVITLPSGLQYKVISQGNGPIPTTSDTVVTHYRGTLIDGTEFDSSYKRGKPAEFPVTGVIKGWTEILQLMKVGSKWEVVIPSELAYGERGAGQNIAPNAVLKFELELMEIKAKEPVAGATPAEQPVVTSDIIKVPSADELKKGAKIEVIKASDVERLQKEAEAAKKAEKPKQ